MSRRIYASWNWQFDRGETVIADRERPPLNHAIAYHDRLGRLYRVEVIDQLNPSERYVYDYFCDRSGKVLQKRSYSDEGEVDLIIDYDYDLERGVVAETAWRPSDDITKRIERPLASTS